MRKIKVTFYPRWHKRLKMKRWYWRATSSNGNIIADCAEGDGYQDRRGAEKTFTSIAAHLHAGVFVVEE